MPLSFGSGGGSASAASSRHEAPNHVASGRKSPDPFKRFRRNSLGNMLSLHHSAYPPSSSTCPSSAEAPAAKGPRSPPPPRPSSSSKPAFSRSRKAKPASLSLLASSTAAQPSPGYLEPSAFGEPTEELDSAMLSPPCGALKPNKIQGTISPLKPTQAWYQAQQRTVDLCQPSPSLQLPPSISLSLSRSPGSPSHLEIVRTASGRRLVNDHEVQIISRQTDEASLRSLPSSSSQTMQMSGYSDRLYRGNASGGGGGGGGSSSSATPSANGCASSSVEGPHYDHASAASSSYSLVPSATARSSLDQSRSSHAHGAGLTSSGPSSVSHHHMRPSSAMSFRPVDNHSNTSLPSFYSTDAASPRETSHRNGGYLSPSPGTSAHPFLNKHAATVGKASAASSAGSSARSGLFHYYGATSASASACASPSQRQSSHSSRSEAPIKAAKHPTQPDSSHGHLAKRASDEKPLPSIDPSSADGPSTGERGRTYPCDPEAALSASSLAPLPPPRRVSGLGGAKAKSTAGSDVNGSGSGEAWSSGRSVASHGGVAMALGQVGQLGAAVGRKGWELMRTLNGGGGSSSSSSSSSGGAFGSGSATASKSAIPVRSGKASRGEAMSAPVPAENQATQQWLAALEEDADGVRPSTAASSGASRAKLGFAPNASKGHIFGAPLRDAVLRSRLMDLVLEGDNDAATAAEALHARTASGTRLSIPDLGTDFTVNMSFLDEGSIPSPRRTSRQRQSVPGQIPASRAEARAYYLPGIVVRCIESLERWGSQEEGIYRLSGRSSHTSKLRAIFDEQKADLRLEEISPADLDINSVCSVLKSYLRELPDGLVPAGSSTSLDAATAQLLAAAAATTNNAGSAAATGTSNVSGEAVSKHLLPIVSSIPSVNWYLLREIANHLGWLSGADRVAHTKMPLSNLCLVLAPTLSLSVMTLKLIVEHRADIFMAPGPAPDPELEAAFKPAKPPLPRRPSALKPLTVTSPIGGVGAAKSPLGSSTEARRIEGGSTLQSPPATPSRLPQPVRKRSSTASLAGLLGGSGSLSSVLRPDRRNPDSPSAPLPKPGWLRGHQSKGSVGSLTSRTSQLDHGEAVESVVDSASQHSPASSLFERPSTSLGHSSDLRLRRDPIGLDSEPASPARRGLAREAAILRRLHGSMVTSQSMSASTSPSLVASPRSVSATPTAASSDQDNADDDDDGPPIARYYARLRKEAATPEVMASYRFGQASSERTLPKSPSVASSSSSIPVLASRGRADLGQWPHRPSELSLMSSSSLESDAAVAATVESTPMAPSRSTGSGALDRPRPPTSRQRSFFAGRERRKNSIAGLEGIVVVSSNKHARGWSKGSSMAERSREMSHEGNASSSAPTTATVSTTATTASPSACTAGAASAEADGTATRPLNIVKKPASSMDEERGGVTKKASTVSSSCSTNTVSTAASSSVATHDVVLGRSVDGIETPPRLASGDEVSVSLDDEALQREAVAFSKSLENAQDDARSDIERYLDERPVGIEARRRLFEQAAR
ncbi:hypothetical protein ACQY0O_003241 [Thecaphora frezii]